MKTLISVTILLFFGLFLGSSDAIKVKKHSVLIPRAVFGDYDKEWTQVDSLINLGLPKSALTIVEDIYTKAKSKGNSDQILKSYIYRLKLKNSIEDYAFEDLLYELRNDADSAQYPTRCMMHSMLAEMYWMYYTANRWQFQNRINTLNFDNDDIQTWTLDQLTNEVITQYLLSLEDVDKLKVTKIDYYYSESITWGTYDRTIRPTLYDFLINRAIDYFTNSEVSLSRPADYFQLKEDFYFNDAKKFTELDIVSNDTSSIHYNGFKLLQDLISFRLSKTDEDASFIDAELKRLSYIYSFSVHENKSELYFNSIKNLWNTYKGKEVEGEIAYKVADFYNTLGSKYSADDEATFEYKSYKQTGLEICNDIIKKYPKSVAAEKCLYLKSVITNHSLSFLCEKIVSSSVKFAAKVSYSNIDKIYFRIATIDREKYKSLYQKYWGEELYDELIKASTQVNTFNKDIPGDIDYNYHSTEVLLDGLANGFYFIVAANNEKFTYQENIVSYALLTVSDLSYIKQEEEDGSFNVFVLDRKTGKPLEGVNVETYYQKWNSLSREYVEKNYQNYVTDKNGFFKIQSNAKEESISLYMKIKKGTDLLISDDYMWLYYSKYETYDYFSVNFFTDRGIYRPGQTVFFKGIVLKKNDYDNEIVPNYATTVTLYDPNWQVQSTLDLTTNDFGSFNGSFTIPTTSLSGSYQIYTPYGSKYIQVEEYKRPTFEVEMLPFDGNYILDDSVSVTGKATNFAGSNLTDATVDFRVQRQPIWRGWWYRYIPYTTVEIANGTITTDETGQFEIKFKAIPDLTFPVSEYMAFNYSITADVTDINGETQSTYKSVTVGYRALQLDINLMSTINKAQVEEDFYDFRIYTQNLNYEDVDASGTIKIYKLKDNSEPLRSRMWTKPDTYLYTQNEWNTQFAGNIYDEEDQFKNYVEQSMVFESKFNTADTNIIDISKMQKWESGVYVAKMTSEDAFGNEVNYQENFVLYSETDKTVPYNTIDWFSEVKTFCEPGETAKFLIGSSLKNVKVLYQIESKYKIVKEEWLELNNSQKLIEIPVTEEDRGNFSVHFVFIKDNRMYSHSSVVYVPRTDKQLDIEFTTFRDKLLPGAEEEWKLTIKGENGEKVMAEMLATLYDASLDEFVKNYWDFNIYQSYYTSMPWSTNTFYTTSSYSYEVGLDPYIYFPYRYYDALNWFGFSYYSYNSYNYRYYDYEGDYDDGVMFKALGGSKRDTKEVYAESLDEAPMEEQKLEDISIADKVTDAPAAILLEGKNEIATASTGFAKDIIDGRFENVKVRTDFSETAFFYPQLQTNEEGEVVIRFVIPESLTSWRMMGFAHTKDLKYGFVENELVTQKELMVIPNPPRFFREGDKIEFPVKISNIGTDDLKGDIKLELFDALTLEPVKDIFAKKTSETQTFEVKAGLNTSVTWNLEIPEGYGLITYKVVAVTDNLSDGEQKPIPVLTNRMLVTESLPLWVRGNSEKSFEFTKLINSGKSSTLKNHKVTLEFTSNPAWYAVQSLPYLMEYPYECAEQTFSRFYANSLASHIANSNPKIKAVFDAWKNYDEDALLSNLEKNEELKQVLLEETPWVLQAQNETARKKQVGLLFDLNKMSTELETAMKKLIKAQAANGGWSWFEGMPESRYITQHIVCGMGHLDKLGVTSVREESQVWNMVTKGIDYLDVAIADDYKWLKKYYSEQELEENHLTSIAIQYLYARSFFTDVEIPSKSKEAFDYFSGQCEKYWLSQSKYNQGMISLARFRYGDKTTPMKIVKSVKEFAIIDDELGMFWKDNIAGYYWYEAPIETQALLIEMFHEVADDQEAVDEAKIWLLKNKQTNDWKTTKATVEAVYALLLQGTEWLADSEICEITMGGKVIDPKQLDDTEIEAGTGYFKTSWSGDEIKPDMGKISVKNTNDVIAWGAVYWQYFEDLDKITPAETPLKLEKKLFKEVITDKGDVIEPITEDTELQVGDKIIVRIELRVDREMDYVHMKDMRASGFEPINVISKYKWQDGLGYYESTKDAATNFFISSLPKGTFVFEYPLRVTHNGNFSNGITTIQCMYAPEFTSHSEGIRVTVEGIN